MRTLFALLLLASVARADVLKRVDVLPLGDVADVDVQSVSAGLRAIYGIEVHVRAAQPLPKSAWYAPRRRWRAEKILAWMQGQPLDGADHLLALTSQDISTTKDRIYDWGVIGLGDLDGRNGVLSRFRCTKGVSADLVSERIGKVAVHELGHTLGLEHCPNEGCIMEDAEGKVAGTDHELDLCAECRRKLAARGFVIPAKPTLPWPVR